MSYNTRKIMYQSIVELRKKPLISYVTSIRPNMSANMAGDSITQIIDQINAIPTSEKEIDFLIVSNGGDPITSLRIISLLRERFQKITVLLPYVAYSAATILSLGADKIIMHPFSNLGPVDPQLTVSKMNDNGHQGKLQFSSEDLRNFIDFIKTDVGISDQQHLISAITPLISDVGSLPIGSAKRSQQLSLTLSEKMLNTHHKDRNKAKAIAKALNTSYYHHGYAVGRKEAKSIGLNIENPDNTLEALLWNIWKDFEDEMKCSKPYDVINEIMSDPTANQLINKVPIVDIPANTPLNVAHTIITQKAQAATVSMRSSFKQKIIVAAIESVYHAKAAYTNAEILYWRNADMSLGINYTSYPSGWVVNN